MSRSDLLPIEQKVTEQLQNYFPDRTDVSLVIGVSGGIDSMCLLHILHKLDVQLHVVHINYQKRGAASDKDAILVEDTATALGIECKIISVDPDEAKGRNFQQWAREIRYRSFEMKLDQTESIGITIAHHQDDQIETILQRIFRGSGLASWSAMQVWNGRLFRPLLNVSRKQIKKYCKKQSIAFRDDTSNFESDFARNFLRNEWLSELKQHFPGWRTNVLRVVEQARVFRSSLQFILQNLRDEKDCLDRSRFLALNEALQKSVLIYYVKQVDSNQKVSRHALSEIKKLKDLQTGKSIQLTQNMELMCDRKYLKLIVNTEESFSYLSLHKEDLQAGGILFNGLYFEFGPFEKPDFSNQLYIDAKSVKWPLHLQRWVKGDRFQPLGMEGHQAVADHLTNRKVSAVGKSNALVLQSFDEIICAVIFPSIENRPPGSISEKVKCDESTRQCLTVKRV